MLITINSILVNLSLEMIPLFTSKSNQNIHVVLTKSFICVKNDFRGETGNIQEVFYIHTTYNQYYARNEKIFQIKIVCTALSTVFKSILLTLLERDNLSS